jgi:hypothetical protein
VAKPKVRKADFRQPKLPGELAEPIERFQKSLSPEPTFQKAFEHIVKRGLEAEGLLADAKTAAA